VEGFVLVAAVNDTPILRYVVDALLGRSRLKWATEVLVFIQVIAHYDAFVGYLDIVM
jgi:hypothetical protein